MVLSGCWLASTRNSENNQQLEMYPRRSSCGIFFMSPGGWPEMDLAVVFNSPSHPNKSPVLFQRGFQMQKCQVITTRTTVQHPDSLSTCKVTLCGFPNSGPILPQRERFGLSSADTLGEQTQVDSKDCHHYPFLKEAGKLLERMYAIS